jgi:hypothetical protein
VFRLNHPLQYRNATEGVPYRTRNATEGGPYRTDRPILGSGCDLVWQRTATQRVPYREHGTPRRAFLQSARRSATEGVPYRRRSTTRRRAPFRPPLGSSSRRLNDRNRSPGAPRHSLGARKAAKCLASEATRGSASEIGSGPRRSKVADREQRSTNDTNQTNGKVSGNVRLLRAPISGHPKTRRHTPACTRRASDAVAQQRAPINRLWTGTREGRDMSGGLKGFNTVDVNQGTVHCPICLGIPDDHSGFQKHDVFRVPDFMDFAVREPQNERLKGLAPQPFSNRFHIHTVQCTTRKTR